MFERMRDMFAKRLAPSFIEAQNKTAEHTPDWWNISQFRHQLFFAYGNDMPERREYDNLIGNQGVKRYGSAYTAKNMTVFSFDDGTDNTHFPIAFEEEFKYNSPRAPYSILKGELLGIPTENLLKLDNYYANRTVFMRKRTTLILPVIDKRYNNSRVAESEGYAIAPAWIYVGIEQYWSEHMDAGYTCRPAPRFDNLFLKDYYFYGSYDFSPD